MIDTCFYLYQSNINWVYQKKNTSICQNTSLVVWRKFNVLYRTLVLVDHWLRGNFKVHDSLKHKLEAQTGSTNSENDATQESVINFTFLYETEAYDNIVTHGGVILLSHSRAPNLTWKTIWMFQ